MSFNSLQQIISVCEEEKIEFWDALMQEDMREADISFSEIYSKMQTAWKAMLSADESYDKSLKSPSGLVGGEGYKLHTYLNQKDSKPLSGTFVSQAMIKALQMAESNACMKRIVAAPTAGSCGVIPAVLVPYYKNNMADEDKIVKALFVAGGIGQVIAHRASISGAEGGCQAEIGSASAMAAGALVYLQGGNSIQIIHATALALKGLLGLVCDPVAGLVEIPCVKRNVIGAVNAISCADMAMAGIESKIPPDQVIDAMGEIGQKMDVSLRETSKAGLASTPFAKEFISNHK